MAEFDPEDLGLHPTWRIGSYNRTKDSVDRVIPAEANFFMMSYLDRNLPNLPPFKMYTIDQGVAERCYTTDYTRLSISAYKIPNKNAFENVMEQCKDPRWHGALGEWEEDHKMSHFLDDYLGGNIEREQRDNDIEAALELATAEKVPESSEQAVFWIGKYSDEFWDEETRRMRSGRGLTTERELADMIFTGHKQAYRMRDLRTFHLFFMNRCAIRSHWFGMPEYIWDHPTHDPNADLILFMRSENVQRKLEDLQLRNRFPKPVKTEETFDINTYFSHQRVVREAKRQRVA